MSINWDEYEPYDPGVSGPLDELPRSEARRAFNRCMETKGSRIEMLRHLLKANGVEPGSEDAAVQELNDWFVANVEADPDQAGRPRSIWYSVVHDVALFLGEVMIERHPNLRWEFFIWGKKDIAYQQHVIMGFSTEDPKQRTNLDLERMVAAYAHRIIESQGSIPHYGKVTVRGATVDVDAVAAQSRERGIETDKFVRLLQQTPEPRPSGMRSMPTTCGTWSSR